MVCCGCNRRGLCKGCVCVKAQRFCVDCVPCRLGSCQNLPGPCVAADVKLKPASISQDLARVTVLAMVPLLMMCQLLCWMWAIRMSLFLTLLLGRVRVCVLPATWRHRPPFSSSGVASLGLPAPALPSSPLGGTWMPPRLLICCLPHILRLYTGGRICSWRYG